MCAEIAVNSMVIALKQSIIVWIVLLFSIRGQKLINWARKHLLWLLYLSQVGLRQDGALCGWGKQWIKAKLTNWPVAAGSPIDKRWVWLRLSIKFLSFMSLNYILPRHGSAGTYGNSMFNFLLMSILFFIKHGPSYL